MKETVKNLKELRNIAVIITLIFSTLATIILGEWDVSKTIVAVWINGLIFSLTVLGVTGSTERRLWFFMTGVFLLFYPILSMSWFLENPKHLYFMMMNTGISMIVVTIITHIAQDYVIAEEEKEQIFAQKDLSILDALKNVFGEESITPLTTEEARCTKFDPNNRDFVFDKLYPIGDPDDIEFYKIPANIPPKRTEEFFKDFLEKTIHQTQYADWKLSRILEIMDGVSGCVFQTLDEHDFGSQFLHAVLYCKHSGILVLYTTDVANIDKLLQHTEE